MLDKELMKLDFVHVYTTFFVRHFFIIGIIILCIGKSIAANPFFINNIKFKGVKRINSEIIFNYLPIHFGEMFTNQLGALTIKKLYATGLFKDVRIEIKNNILWIIIKERPLVFSINFIGIKKFHVAQLKQQLHKIKVSELYIYSAFRVKRARQEIKRQYLARGFYSIQIFVKVTPIKSNYVIITFVANEGIVSHIRLINFVGNQVFSDRVLRHQLNSKSSNFFTWYTKDDIYLKKKLAHDIYILRLYYLNRGYLEMQIDSIQVLITPNKQDIYIIINISEGNKFTVSNITFIKNALNLECYLATLIELKVHEIYSATKLLNSIQKITDYLSNFGYVFASVNFHPIINRDKKVVSFIIKINPGTRIYVRHINISGNTKTRDYVVRREFRQFESSWFDGKKIKLSRDRINRLGYFKEVRIDAPFVFDREDQVDINIHVKENETNNITFGAGFSQHNKLNLISSIFQDNIFGIGQSIGVDVNTNSFDRTIAVSQTNPYVTNNGISRIYEVFLRTNKPPISRNSNYRVKTLGSDVRFGIPFSEIDRIFFGIGLENIKIHGGKINAYLYRTHVQDLNNRALNRIIFDEYQYDTKLTTAVSFPLTVSWYRDNRDNFFSPTTGHLQSLSFELSSVGTLRYYRTTYQQYRYFHPFLKRAPVFAISTEFSHGKGLNHKPYPMFKNFYAGGIGSVRGYEDSSLGDVQDQYGNSLGGSSRFIGSVEIQFPFFKSMEKHNLQWFLFFDGGNVFSHGNFIELSSLRYSIGVGINWISPIGPLKFSYSKPLNFKSGDKLRNFQFQLGTVF